MLELDRGRATGGDRRRGRSAAAPMPCPVAIERRTLPDEWRGRRRRRANGEELRVAATDRWAIERLADRALRPAGASEGFLASRPVLAVALVAFFLVALVFVALHPAHAAVRTDQRRCSRRRSGSATATSAAGPGHAASDEMAGLATEFNKMSDRLVDADGPAAPPADRDRAARSAGSARRSPPGLDREALLEILAETAVRACERRVRPDRAQRPGRLRGPTGSRPRR